MKGLCLVNYSVKGIKALDQTVSLSFYKKTITKPTDFRSYNIKGIYGINGSGKSAIITSVKIFRNLLPVSTERAAATTFSSIAFHCASESLLSLLIRNSI